MLIKRHRNARRLSMVPFSVICLSFVSQIALLLTHHRDDYNHHVIKHIGVVITLKLVPHQVQKSVNQTFGGDELFSISPSNITPFSASTDNFLHSLEFKLSKLYLLDLCNFSII
mmetsp:Transcript_58470/g.70387  ORF Transcript_58470/g.70387 Transcript_58470/m.70387 type:complete len:114 (-) Transcript_58470:452-793(-)